MSKWCPNDVLMMFKWCLEHMWILSKWCLNDVQTMSEWCPYACTMITVHACTMIIVHASTMIIVERASYLAIEQATERSSGQAIEQAIERTIERSSEWSSEPATSERNVRCINKQAIINGKLFRSKTYVFVTRTNQYLSYGNQFHGCSDVNQTLRTNMLFQNYSRVP